MFGFNNKFFMFVSGTVEKVVAMEAEGTEVARAVDMVVDREGMAVVAAMAATERMPKKRKIL